MKFACSTRRGLSLTGIYTVLFQTIPYSTLCFDRSKTTLKISVFVRISLWRENKSPPPLGTKVKKSHLFIIFIWLLNPSSSPRSALCLLNLSTIRLKSGGCRAPNGLTSTVIRARSSAAGSTVASIGARPRADQWSIDDRNRSQWSAQRISCDIELMRFRRTNCDICRYVSRLERLFQQREQQTKEKNKKNFFIRRID